MRQQVKYKQWCVWKAICLYCRL